jgi:hypothetical protein
MNEKSEVELNLERAKILLDEWKARHQHCWNSLQRYGLAAVTVSVIPYLRSEFYQELHRAVLIFPVVAWLLALAAAWLFAAEYVKCRPVEQKYYQMLGEAYRPEKFQHEKRWQKVLAKRVGWNTVYIFVLGFTLLSIANGAILWRLARVVTPTPVIQKTEKAN